MSCYSVTRCLLEAEEWPSSLFDCASPHSSGFHMFAALDPTFGKILWNIFCVLQSEFNWLQLCQFALPTMPPLGLRWMISSLTSGRKLKRNTERNVLPHRRFVAHHVFMNVFSIPRGQQAILHDGKIPRVQCGVFQLHLKKTHWYTIIYRKTC